MHHSQVSFFYEAAARSSLQCVARSRPDNLSSMESTAQEAGREDMRAGHMVILVGPSWSPICKSFQASAVSGILPVIALSLVD